MQGILLAAGFSRRFGVANKLLQALPDGRLMAVAAAENLIQAIPNSIAVLRADNKPLADLLTSKGFKLVFCDDNTTEMADSLVTAVRFSAQWTDSDEGFVIALADMPYIASETIAAVAASLKQGASIVVPTYQTKRGHPVAFASQFRQELENLQGDEGARSIIKRHADQITFLACDDAGILADIDTVADLGQSVSPSPLNPVNQAF